MRVCGGQIHLGFLATRLKELREWLYVPVCGRVGGSYGKTEWLIVCVCLQIMLAWVCARKPGRIEQLWAQPIRNNRSYPIIWSCLSKTCT